MKEEIVKALIEWVNTHKAALHTWVLDMEAPRMMVSLVNIWVPGQPIFKQFRFYKREVLEYEAIIIGFSMEGNFVTNLPVLRQVFRNENLTAHLFAELAFDYCELLETYKYELQ